MGSWMPITPEKTIPTRPNPVLPDGYGRPVPRENRQELAGIPVGHIAEMPNYNRAVNNLNPIGQAGPNEGYYGDTDFILHERSRKINQIAASYAQALSNGNSGRNNSINLLAIKNAAALASANRSNGRSTSLGNRALIPNLNSQVENWMASNSSNLLIHNQAHNSSSSLLSNSSIFQFISSDGFPIAYQSNYKINSAPRTEASAGSCVSSTPPFSTVTQELLTSRNKPVGDFLRTESDVASSVTTTLPHVTPDQFKKLQYNQLSANENISMDVSSSQEKDKQENLLTICRNETIQCNYDEHLQNVAPSEVISISTPEEKKDSNNANDQGIDLNKTPQQKPPKRRKHRPKVIVEGKRKKNPRTATPKSTKTKENPGGKRKYVRRKGLKESATQQADILRESTDPSAGAAASSRRRALNFDLEKIGDENQGKRMSQQEEMQERYQRTFNLNLDSQTKALDRVTDTRYRSESTTMFGQQNELPVENQQPGIVSNHTHHKPEAVSNQIHQQPGIVCNQTLSMSEILADYISMPERQACAASLPPRKDFHMENFNVVASTVDARNTDPSQNRNKNGYTSTKHQIYAEGIGQTVFQANTILENLERTRQPIPPSTPQSAPKTSSSLQVARGSKREYSHAIEQNHPCVINSMGSSLLYQDIFQMEGLQRNSNSIDSGSAEAHKKKKIENGPYTIINGKPSSVHVIKDCSIQVQKISASDINGNGSPLQRNNGTMNFDSGRYKIANMGTSAVNTLNSDWHTHSMASGYNLPKEHIFSAQHLHTEKMGGTNRLTSVLGFTSSTASENCSVHPLTPPGRAHAPADRLAPKTHRAIVSAEKNAEQALAKSASSTRDQMLPEQRRDLFDPYQYSAERRGALVQQIYPIPMDEIIHRFNSLNLNASTNHVEEHEQNAIVPYRQDGTIVPYEGFEFIKKRKPRPKVDLDAETNRIWNLLMGKEGNEGLEEMDKEKEKWWEEERRVFQGRADSFIARMHLVQGDRRFSKWKGSVVDSVIGVFLTQNVSDHLSSSAFMSLAARFPLKSNNRTSSMDDMNILVEEPEVSLLNPDDAIQWSEQVPRHPLSSQSSMTPYEQPEPRRENETSGIERASLLEAHSHSLEEEVISPQDSFSSSILQGTGIKSYSGSNSETEDLTPGCQTNQDHGSTNFLQEGDANLFQDIYNCLNDKSQFEEQYGHGHIQLNDIGNSQQESKLDSIEDFGSSLTFTQLLNINSPQNQLPLIPSSDCQLHMTSYCELLECSEIYSGECVSSQPSTACGFPKAKDVGYTSQSNRQLVEDVSETTVQQNGIPMPEDMSTMSPPAPLRKDSMQQQTLSQPGSHSKYNEPSCESRSQPELVNLAETPAKVQHVPNCPDFTEKTCINGRISVLNKLSENQVIEPNSRVQEISNRQSYGEANPKIPKSKKGKVDGEKKNAIDWDRLRKKVQSSDQKKERSKDTMDSLDYEAIRCADVKEISNAIKERGMNNMLAQRIKEFLNRLVTEHDSIDLEWLREVPPDQAKDYLLSIRGLGLKSVECVRLLTLHHLAFPVDTNVGRIAVRLGWVPLQPLPESLQLHLLELYPMLESIQKYLWPRLCKLDQRTLYELHYQLITFGKVFCTKSKPNCNACPMRGECRHFASAFASARLALPGPEEKNIVTSTAPTMAERKPTVVINPVPLPPPEENSLRVAEIGTGNCEPIIEEPASPEQECTEISESDIEDRFYEDPDEIPTIKLNIEEFTETLQNYMQENMELQEADMSKALVALNPAAASIPAPKLKNVSRLRTEHQVYQLPDSHPLLKRMDRREPDDPSPYLLAIWTPGETANSIQPPEKSCGSQESGKLCNEKTCFSCNSLREANSQTVRGTLLIPCRTAMRGSFPLNGTYFQVNEVFADHESSINPIDVPREWIWNLPRRVVYFGTSVSTIFKGLSTEGIQFCFWKGFVCVRGFDQKSRAPRPLMARLHFPASKLAKTKNENK